MNLKTKYGRIIALFTFVCKFIAKKSFFCSVLVTFLMIQSPMPSPLILEIQSNFPANIRKDIDVCLSLLAYAPIWQTIEWQLMLAEAGYVQKSFFVGIYQSKKLLSYVLIEKRSIGFGLTGFFCIGGPIIGSAENHLDILSLILRQLAQKEKVVFIQMEPLTPVILPDFQVGKYKSFIEKHTALIDLRQDNESLLARMKPKGRYNIRIAEKAGIQVDHVLPTEEHLDIFYNILSETLERDNFAANSREYFRIFLQYLDKQKIGGLFFAKK